MSRLRLTDIKKAYQSGGEIVQALKGISLEFRESEFVSILGPSGCGKTTLLNIIGGLDRYDEGDLSLGGQTTKKFKDKDWDAYRNHSIGFVFQNYNLIAHQTILQNVEIAMTLSGVSSSERKERAKQALVEVGLGDKLNKKPNQLSGGQMQRVAIARALVNNPSIILADEPTGALDSHTSVQVMDILQEISKTRLVIMVTHNGELAEAYSNRVIHLRDGEVQSDTNPILKDRNMNKSDSNKKESLTLGKTAMSLYTAMSLSFKNLLTKKGRTFITAFAGSIGIIGIALVLALSNGLSNYIANLQSETLASLPVTISAGTQSSPGFPDGPFGDNRDEEDKYPEEDVLYRLQPNEDATQEEHVNVFTTEFFTYISNLPKDLPDAVNAIAYTRDVEVNLLAKGENDVVKFETSDSNAEASPFEEPAPTYWNELPDDEAFILSMYDLIGEGSRYPTKMNEVAIVVNEYNGVDEAFFEKLGMLTGSTPYKLSDFIGKTILKYIPNDSYYKENDNGLFVPAAPESWDELYEQGEGMALTITGVLRPKAESTSTFSYLSKGLVYTTALTDHIVEHAKDSKIAAAQKASERDVILNTPFANDEAKQKRLRSLGADTTPVSISIYPKDFNGKDEIKKYLDDYNDKRANTTDEILYSDQSEIIGSTIQTVLNIVSSVLVGFAAISLVVSTIMIGIITYVSVLERTKEIGILRSLGARKKDISRVFNAETLIVGFVSGALGIAISYMLVLVINSILAGLLDIKGLAQLTVTHSTILIFGSMLLTLIAGFIPARIATKKDPVLALRTE